MREGATSEDTVYQGRVRLIQPAKGFRAGTDALLLAAALEQKPDGRALEVGCGCGGALLPGAFRCPDTRFTAIDVDPAMVELARKGVRANGFETRVHIDAAEVTDWVRSQENAFDLVFSNPPFFAEGTISPPADGKQTAYVETVPLEKWMKAMVFAARPRAPIVMLHRAADLARILAGLDKWTGEITVLPIHPQKGAEANRVLVRARKGLRRGRVRLLRGLDLRDAAGEPSETLLAVRRGEAIDWR